MGKNAYVAAGSVVTEDVPEDSLAIARAPQTTKAGWTRQRRARRQAKPTAKKS